MSKKKAKTKSAASKGFNLFKSNKVAYTQEALDAIRAKRKKAPRSLKAMADFQPYFLEIDNFALQAAIGMRGLRAGTLVEFIAGEGIGKTTLVFTLLGALMRTSNAPCLFVNTEGENKLPNKDRISRCLDSDPEMAQQMLNVLEVERGSELKDTAELIEDWIQITRKFLNDNGGQDVPIVVAIDTMSKLLSTSEAADLIDTGTKAKAKGLGGGSNLEFSKNIHEWARRLLHLQEEYNVLLIVVSHQNTKIDMGGFGPTLSADVSAGYNKTKRGGKALDQNAALQCTLKRVGFAKNSKQENVGHKIQLRVVKSSTGADHNTLDYVLTTRYSEDSEGYQEPALDFAAGLADMFVEHKLLNTKVALKRYTSEELGVEKVTAAEFYRAFNERSDLKEKVGSALGIDGYTKATWIKDAIDTPESEVDPEDVPEVDQDYLEQDAED